MTNYKLCSNPEVLKVKLPDSYGLIEKGQCRCTNVANCLGEKCACYHNSPIKSFARLRSLDEKKQAYIAKKYYGGRRPWTKLEVKSQW
ncbi:MAG: hypothetical protein PHF87_10235 [Desulfotomaculaceae bacterium]|nr:hypothetical protein [Desulfotomaculaceae bacterium]